jgi:hypothetical protein
MDAASLIKLAAARGIDLNHVAGVASRLDGAAAPRKLSATELKYRKEHKFSLDVAETVKGRESRTYRQPGWTIGELGQAAQGLGPIPWAAALYSYAGSRHAYYVLWQALATEAHRIAKREGWPAKVVNENGEPRFFREDLAELVLIEDANKHIFAAAPALHALYMNVTVISWEKHLNDPYRSLKGAYDRWLDTARGWISRRICEPHHAASI